ATRRDGQPCRAIANRSGFCMAHDPTLAEKRREAARQGGRNKARIARLGKLVPPRLMSVYETLEEALGQVHKGELTPQQATAMAALAGAMVRVLTSGEIEERLRRLEERQAQASNGRRPR
ncbi:MAG: hypothetical protein MUP14_10070, partial [Dehalococcoidia bacterium]|nr:hypothetical protein [Dehalococcoidia bacterium]